jgi:hypothetical protein
MSIESLRKDYAEYTKKHRNTIIIYSISVVLYIIINIFDGYDNFTDVFMVSLFFGVPVSLGAYAIRILKTARVETVTVVSKELNYSYQSSSSRKTRYYIYKYELKKDGLVIDTYETNRAYRQNFINFKVGAVIKLLIEDDNKTVTPKSLAIAFIIFSLAQLMIFMLLVTKL